MESFDERRDLFLRIGLDERAATVAALGREYRTEAEARAAEAAEEAAALADTMFTDARARSSTQTSRAEELLAIQQEVARVPDRVAAALRGVTSTGPSVALAPAAESAVSTVRTALRMSESDARGLVQRIYVREVARSDQAHADRYMASFANGLRANASEAAPR